MKRLPELKLLEDKSSISVSNTSIVKGPKTEILSVFCAQSYSEGVFKCICRNHVTKGRVDVDIFTATLLRFGNLDLKGPARL